MTNYLSRLVKKAHEKISQTTKSNSNKISQQSLLKTINCKINPSKIKGTLTINTPVSLPAVSVNGNCHVGAFTYIGRGGALKSTSIGSYCSIATDVVFGPHQHPIDWLSSHSFVSGGNGGFAGNKEYQTIKGKSKPTFRQADIIVGSDVWIGLRAIVMSGVTIGDGAIVAANSVVTKDVPPYAIVGGVPAKVIKKRFDDQTIEKLIDLRWWDHLLDQDVVKGIDYSNIDESIRTIKDLINARKLSKLGRKYLIDGKNQTITSVPS